MMTVDEMNQIRAELGLTYQKICMESGVPISTVQKVLGGITKDPQLHTMQKLELALHRLKYGYDQYRETLKENKNGTMMVKEPGSGCKAKQKGSEEHNCTLAERNALPDERRTELINGVLFDMASPTTVHQNICTSFFGQVDACIKTHHSECVPFLAPTDVCIDCDEYTAVQPDVFIVCDRKQITRKNIQGAPAFILEVLSPSTKAKDQKEKLVKYLDAGVKEYWMIDPDRRKVIVYDMTQNTGDPRTDAYDISIYGFRDRIPLLISEGKCEIDMNPVRENLEGIFGDEW